MIIRLPLVSGTPRIAPSRWKLAQVVGPRRRVEVHRPAADASPRMGSLRCRGSESADARLCHVASPPFDPLPLCRGGESFQCVWMYTRRSRRAVSFSAVDDAWSRPVVGQPRRDVWANLRVVLARRGGDRLRRVQVVADVGGRWLSWGPIRRRPGVSAAAGRGCRCRQGSPHRRAGTAGQPNAGRR